MAMLGFRINPAPPQAPADLVEQLRSVVTAHISDSMNRLCGAIGLRHYHRGGRLAGTAFTVKTRPGDNLMIHKALDLARPGDVLVVDGGGELHQALVGELMQMYAVSRGLAGFVIDGAVRDVAILAASDFPCFARGATHRGPYKDGPGEINVPVSIGGLVINPGDIVVGDEDGLVAFPQAVAADLLKQAREKAAAEDEIKRAIRAGRFDRPWLDQTLRARGVV
jgi:RraA family protein